MIRVDQVVVNQSKIYVVNRNRNIGALRIFGGVEFPDILYFRVDDTGDLLFQPIVDSRLQILVNGQIDIVAGNGILMIDNLQGIAHVVHIHSL